MGSTLHVACAGDSRAVLCRGQRAERLSRDHTLLQEEEKRRIAAAGGRFWRSEGGQLRVMAPVKPGIAIKVTRVCVCARVLCVCVRTRARCCGTACVVWGGWKAANHPAVCTHSHMQMIAMAPMSQCPSSLLATSSAHTAITPARIAAAILSQWPKLSKLELPALTLIYTRACVQMIAMTRSVGDVEFKEPVPLLTAEPEVTSTHLVPHDDKFVIYASDGGWRAHSVLLHGFCYRR